MGVRLFLLAVAASLGGCAIPLQVCLSPCAGVLLVTQAVCPLYHPEASDQNGSGDRVLPLDAVGTVDGAPAPPVHDAVMIYRGPLDALFDGDSHVLRTFALAADDEHRLKLPCIPGKGREPEHLDWPDTRGTDPPEWNPPARGSSNVTSCAAGETASYYYIVIREKRPEDVRYFLITRYND